jgi:hypothetical protein
MVSGQSSACPYTAPTHAEDVSLTWYLKTFTDYTMNKYRIIEFAPGCITVQQQVEEKTKSVFGKYLVSILIWRTLSQSGHPITGVGIPHKDFNTSEEAEKWLMAIKSEPKIKEIEL